jgi:hypothetical protein
MANNPPPYSNITGISRAAMKDNAQESLANYDGNARPGELVVNLEVDPPLLYVGNNLGQLTLVASGGNAGGNTDWANIGNINNANGPTTISIGQGAGNGSSSIAIGFNSGNISQADNAVAIGPWAGRDTQGSQSIAIGNGAGTINQSTQAIAIGVEAGGSNQGGSFGSSIAIGFSAGQINQDGWSIAIGSNAGTTDQANNSIILNLIFILSIQFLNKIKMLTM